MAPWERSGQKEYTCEIWKPYLFWFESYGQGWSFSKVGQTSRSRSQGQKLCFHVKGLVTRNTHGQHESPITSGLKVMSKVKVFQKQVKLEGNKLRYHEKVLVIRNTHMKYESFIFDGLKVIRLKFLSTSNADAVANSRAMTLAPQLSKK